MSKDNLLPVWMITEISVIVEKEHQSRKEPYYLHTTYGSKKAMSDRKNAIKRDEENKFMPVGKTAAILKELQRQMNIYNKSMGQ